MFEVEVTDLFDRSLATAEEYKNLEVTIPLSENRTGRVQFSLFDPISGYIGQGRDRVVKVRYFDDLVLRGFVEDPEYDFAAGTVDVPIIGPALTLSEAWFRFGDTVVGGYSVSPSGVWELITRPGQRSYKMPYIRGYNYGSLPTGPTRKAERGSNVWEQIDEIVKSGLGFDLEFQPVDRRFDPHGLYARARDGSKMEVVHFHEDKGRDISKRVYWHKGLIADNAENIRFLPKSSSLKTSTVVTHPAGDRGGVPAKAKALISHIRSSEHYHFDYMAWEAADQYDSNDVIEEKGIYLQGAYSWPPRAFEVIPALQRADDASASGRYWRYGRDFVEGDRIGAAARTGYAQALDLEGRIVKVKLSQANEGATERTAIECVPTVVSSRSEMSVGN